MFQAILYSDWLRWMRVEAPWINYSSRKLTHHYAFFIAFSFSTKIEEKLREITSAL